MIYLLRHGESSVNVTQTLSCRRVDPPLTEAGQAQADQVAAWLADKPIRRIYTSPMQRAVQTAQASAQRFGLAPVVAEELREIDCGVLEGRHDVEAWKAFQAMVVSWFSGDIEAGFEGGETGRHALERFARLVRSLPDDGSDSLLVGHGGIFAWGVLKLCDDLKPSGGWDLYLPNTGLVLVERKPGGYSCAKWGLADHLPQASIVDIPDELR